MSGIGHFILLSLFLATGAALAFVLVQGWRIKRDLKEIIAALDDIDLSEGSQ